MRKLAAIVAILMLSFGVSAQTQVTEFQAFWDEFRTGVLNNDRVRVADLAAFPFTTRGPFDRDPTIKHSRAWFLKRIDGLLAQKHYRYNGPKLEPFTMRQLIEEKTTITAKDFNGGNSRVWVEDFVFEKRRGRWSFAFAYTEK